MKRFIAYGLVLIMGVVFLVSGCNTPDDGTKGGGDGEDVVFDWGSGMKTPLFEAGTENDKWIGQSFPLSGATTITGGPVGNIDLYSSIIIEADLFDRDDNPIQEKVSDLAQFSLLKTNSDWENNKLAKGENMSTGSTSGVPLSGKTDTPEHLLLEVHYWTSLPTGVTAQAGYINVRKLTFKPKTSDIVFDKVYDKGDYLEVQGNKITFKNTTYDECAAIYNFPSEWGTGTDLNNKTITFVFSIPAHTCVLPSGAPSGTEAEHQIHIQASNSDKADDHYNGDDPKSENQNIGQIYKDLDGNTNFTVSGTDLQKAANAKNFTLNAVRIVNNGTYWNGDGGHYRCKSYTIIFDDITISP